MHSIQMKHLHDPYINEKAANKTVFMKNVPDKQIQLKDYKKNDELN